MLHLLKDFWVDVGLSDTASLDLTSLDQGSLSISDMASNISADFCGF